MEEKICRRDLHLSAVATYCFPSQLVVIVTFLLGVAVPQRLAFVFCCITIPSEKIAGNFTSARVDKHIASRKPVNRMLILNLELLIIMLLY